MSRLSFDTWLQHGQVRLVDSAAAAAQAFRLLQSRLGITPEHILDLGVALKSGERKGAMGAKSAVAAVFGQRLQKSKMATTSNWANPRLTERRILYAANDAQVALRVYRAWRTAAAQASTDS